MDKSNILFSTNKSQNKKENSNILHNIKIKKNGLAEIPFKSIFKLKNKKEGEPSSKKTIEAGKYFLKKILKMKKEINKNEFSHTSDDNDINSKNENKKMKKIGTNLKNTLVQLRLESGFEPQPRSSSKKIKNKYNFNKTFNELLPPKKIEKRISENKDNINININNIFGLDNDMSNGQLLNNENNTKLDLLNNEEIKSKVNNTTKINSNINKKNEIMKVRNSNKLNIVDDKQLQKEKFRRLMFRGLVYDSFDDEEEFEDQVNKNFYILPNSVFIIILDTFVAINILYYLLFNPYIMASSTEFIFSRLFTYKEIYHFIIEFIFIIDFIVQFFRAYYDFDENLITDKKKIIFNYLGSWFLIDLITVIPTFIMIKFFYEKDKYKKGYDYICNYGCQSDNLIHLVSFIKIIKIFKILDRNQNQFISFIWTRLSNTSFIDNWGNIIYEVTLAILFLHITSCIHIIVGRNSYPNWIIVKNLSESDFSTIYLTSIYFLITTMTSVGYGDITGNEIREFIFQIFLLIIGIIAYSWLVSSVSNYVIENNKDTEYFISKVNILDDIKLIHPEMGNELYSKIYLYLKQLKIMKKKKDKNILLESLPYNLKNKVLYEINRPLIERLDFFKNFQNSVFILSAVNKLIPIVTNKGDIIIEQDEIIYSMIFVKQGRIGVELAVDMNNIYNKIDDYLNGNFILGEENDKKDKLQYNRKNAFSLMSALHYTMDDSFIFNQGRKLDLNYKKPLSFRKKLLKFMENTFNSNNKVGKPQDTNKKKFKYIKLYYIRKGEHFGDIFMFLNKPSCFTLKVKSPKAELLLLKKIDAIEISSNYPNIWKRANKKSFKNLIHLKELVSKEVKKFCGKNGIKYKSINKDKEMKHYNSLPNIEKLKKSKKNHKKDNLKSRFQKFKRNHKSLIENNKKRLSNLSHNNFKSNVTTINNIHKNIYKKIKNSKPLNKEKKIIPNSLNKIAQNNEICHSREIKKITPYEEDEINNEIYKDELFLENINKDSDNIINIGNEINKRNEERFLDFVKYGQNIISNHHNKNKTLIKLIDSSRGKNNIKLYYHKTKKKNKMNNKNYNVNYNINNSFNINQMQNNIKFDVNKLSITNCICFKINKIYDNYNILSKGSFHKDYNFQRKIKTLFQNKYNIKNNNINNNNKNTILNNINQKLTKKDNRSSSVISNKRSFFKNNTKNLYTDTKNEQIQNLKTQSIENHNIFKLDREEKRKKKEENENNAMLNQITQNIIEGDKNLNNPEIFYNELFANIIQNKKVESQVSLMKIIPKHNTIKFRNKNKV